MPLVASRHITAFLDGEDSPDISNPIHSTEVAAEYGFRAALVGGVTVYGWFVPPILEALGESWLDSGWVDVSFRRPVYPGDQMTAAVSGVPAGVASEMTSGAGELCLHGTVGLVAPAWASEFSDVPFRSPVEAANPMPELSLDDAPIGRELRPMFVPLSVSEAETYADEKQRDPHPRWRAPKPRLHPGWLAARMTPLLKHSYRYGPSIHTRSRILHLGPGFAGVAVVVNGRFVAAFERKGHHYAVLDGLVSSVEGEPIARLRHTTIFRIARPAS